MDDPRRPLDYADAAERGRRARWAMGYGVVIFTFSLVLVLSPLVLGRGSLNRFLVAFGLVGVFIGLGCVLNGALDWLLRGRR